MIDSESREQMEKRHAKEREAEQSLFGSDGAAYFMYYWMDKEGLTDHGGSVPGWLSTRGRSVLHELDRIMEVDDD